MGRMEIMSYKGIKNSAWLTIAGSAIMSLICMYVSYGTLHDLALNCRLTGAILFPVTIDGTMAISMYVKVYFSKIGNDNIWPTVIMWFFVVNSIILNAIGATNLEEMYVYAMPAIGVLSCTELTSRIIEKLPVKKPVTRKKVVKNNVY
jgi:hypothetical protein